jgi:hypothetical protein
MKVLVIRVEAMYTEKAQGSSQTACPHSAKDKYLRVLI